MLINTGAGLNLQNGNGITALMIALGEGNNNFAEMLINAGADINLQAYDGANAFSYAIDGEKIVDKLVSLQLLIAGADIIDDHKPDCIDFFAGNLENWNNVHTAIITNDLNFIRHTSNESLNQVTSSYKLSPLDLAIKLGNIEAIEALLERNVEHNIDKCLQSAVSAKRENVVKFFLERENQLNPGTIYNGRSTFHIACGINYTSIIPLLANYSMLSTNHKKSRRDDNYNQQEPRYNLNKRPRREWLNRINC